MSQLSDEDWGKAWEAFRAARDLPAGEQRAFARGIAESSQIADEVLGMLDDPDPVSPQPGQRIGHYEVIEMLGRGGMGEVFSARDPELDRIIALKCLGPRVASLAGAVDRLVQEAKAVSAINHPNIVTVHEVIRFEGGLAIATELVEGSPLRHWCGRPQPAAQVALWGRQIAWGLEAAHKHGIVHGDIKPENVMVRPDGYLKILDFGLARRTGADEDIDEVPLGTLGYMSPEQIGGQSLTAASDIFSLGTMLLELVTGVHPFLANTASETTRAIATHAPPIPDLQDRARGVPLENLLRAMLSKDPQRRPDAGTVAARLGEVQREKAGKRGRWMRVALVAGLAGVALLAWFLLGRAEVEPRPVRTPHIVAFTTYEGSETQPSFSPDGQSIAFSWTGENDLKRDIYVKAIGSETAVRLTSDVEESSTPVWSPDGRQIAFLRRSPDSSEPRVMVVAAAGGVPRMVGTIANPNGFPGPLGWWPDSKSLVARDSTPRGAALVRISLRDGAKYPLTTPPALEGDGLPVLSPDSRAIAFTRRMVNSGSLCLLAVDTARTHCFDAGGAPGGTAGQIGGIAWEADGKGLVYCDGSAIWRIGIKGDRFGHPAKVLEGIFNEMTGDRQGRRLAFSKTSTDLNIWRTGRDGKHSEKLIASSAEDSEPAFSPDGRQILFRSRRTGVWEFFICEKDGSHTRQVTRFGGGHLGSGRWSPDGQWIAFDGYGNPGEKSARYTNVYVISASGGPVRRITPDSAESIVPAWSHDGRWIYYLQSDGSRQETWKAPFAGGAPVPVAKYGMFDVTESPDGRYLYYTRDAGTSGIWRRETAGGDPLLLKGTEREQLFRYWGLAKGGIYFVEGPLNPVVQFLDLSTMRTRPLITLRRAIQRGPRGLSVSPDGSEFLYVEDDLTLSDIMLIENLL
jgi:serine/threonine protein kinase